MATKELTPRQTQIKALMTQGKKPKEIAKRLKISENAVYQQIRRIRDGGASGRSTSGAARKSGGSSSQSKARTSGRSSSRKRTTTTPRTSGAAPKPPATAEALLKSEIEAHDAAVVEEQAKIEEAKAQVAAAEAAIEAVTAERERKASTLAVLTGEMVAHAKPKPTRQRPSRSAAKAGGDSGAKNAAKSGSGAQGGSQARSNGDGAAKTPTPATQAEREATADHDGSKETATAAA